MYVSVRTTNGKILHLNVFPSDNVASFMDLISKKEKIPAGNFRLLYKGFIISDFPAKKLAEFNIQDDSAFQVLLNLSGAVINFKDRGEMSPLNRWLLHGGEVTPDLIKLCQKKMEKPGSTTDFCIFYGASISTEIMERCVEFIDYIYGKMTVGSSKYQTVHPFDLKLVLDEKAAVYLLQDSYEQIISHGPLENKVILRRLRGPTPGCVSFHQDGPGTTGSVQLNLNSDTAYEGGKVHFLTHEGIVTPSRPSGTLINYHGGVWYGISKLWEGTQYTLVVIGKNTEVGQNDVVHISDKNEIVQWENTLEWSLSEGESDEADTEESIDGGDGLCVICMEEEKVMIAVPCGHVQYCISCYNQLGENNQSCSVCLKKCEKFIRVRK